MSIHNPYDNNFKEPQTSGCQNSPTTSITLLSYSKLCCQDKIRKQAGAELCQAQDMLGLAKPALPRLM